MSIPRATVAILFMLLLPLAAWGQTLRPDEITAAPGDHDAEIKELLRDALEIQSKTNPTEADLDKEIDYFQQILAIKSDHAVAWDGLNKAQAQKQALVVQQSDEQKKKSGASTAADKSEKAFLNGDTATAQKELDTAQRLNPDDPKVVRMAARLKDEFIRQQRQRIVLMATSTVVLFGLITLGWRYIRAPRLPVLEFRDGSDRRVSLDHDIIRLGAVQGEGDRKNDVVLSDPDGMVSRYHCELRKRKAKVFLVDCNSRNGTTVDGRRVPPQMLVPLRNGSTIGVALTYDLRLVFERKK